jgi:hypothetical protein
MSEAEQALTKTPADLVAMAVERNFDLDKLTKVMDLQERWQKLEAKKAFDSSMRQLKNEVESIVKNRHVQFGNTSYDHATLDLVNDTVIPILSKYGFWHKWSFKQPAKDWLVVTCEIHHEMGHTEDTVLEGPPDQSGSKNGIQAVGSAVTYLERYTLLGAVGLATKNQDTDGRPNGNGKPMPRPPQINQAAGQPRPAPQPAQAQPPAAQHWGYFHRIAEKYHSKAEIADYLRQVWGVEHAVEIPNDKRNQALAWARGEQEVSWQEMGR